MVFIFNTIKKHMQKESIIIIVTLFVAFFVVLLMVNKISKSEQTLAVPGKYNQIVLDAGHGGVDAGAIGVNGILEKDINLNITLMLKDMLISCGYDVVLTRDKDESKHDPDITKIPRFKKSDMKNRLEIITKNPSSITISIHQNTFSSKKQNGAQIFYSENNPLSKELAQKIQDSFKNNLQPDNKREIKPAKGDYFLLKQSQTPIVLAECGFLSNPEEASLLSTEDYQSKVAFTLFCAIINFMND